MSEIKTNQAQVHQFTQYANQQQTAKTAQTGTAEVAGAVKDGGLFSGIMNNPGGFATSVVQGINFLSNADKMETGAAAMQGVQVGAGIGAYFGGVGAVIGGVVGGVAGAVASLFGGDSKEHQERTALRDWMRQNTTLGPNLEFQGYAGNGQLGMLSLDGKDHTVDNSQGLLAEATGLTDLLAQSMVGDNDRLKCEFSAMMLNSLKGCQNFEEARQTVMSLMQNMGLTPEAVAERMVSLYQNGVIDKAALTEHLTYLDMLVGNLPGPNGEPVPETTGLTTDNAGQVVDETAEADATGSEPILKRAANNHAFIAEAA